jgi:hypothetical protein
MHHIPVDNILADKRKRVLYKTTIVQSSASQESNEHDYVRAVNMWYENLKSIRREACLMCRRYRSMVLSVLAKTKNSVAFSPQANYTDRATAAYRRS